MSSDPSLMDLKVGDPVVVVWRRGRNVEDLFLAAKVSRVGRIYFDTDGEEFYAKDTFNRDDGTLREGSGRTVFRDLAEYEAQQDRQRREQAARRALSRYIHRLERLNDDELATLTELLEKINV